jgi:hypothetical protein
VPVQRPQEGKEKVMQSIKTYRDKTINNDSFILDEVVFFNCTLKNCDLFYSGGEFQLVESRLDNCRIHFRGAARNTQGLMMTLGMLKAPLQLPAQAIPVAKAN